MIWIVNRSVFIRLLRMTTPIRSYTSFEESSINGGIDADPITVLEELVQLSQVI